jgi:hypothetical protein
MAQQEQSGFPTEILLVIVEYVVTDIKFGDRPKLRGFLSSNRTIYALLSKQLYRTAVLHSSRMTNKFVDALVSSPRLASLVGNLWIATPNFEAFSYQLGSASNSIARILALTPNLRRLAVPSEYFPRFTTPNGMPLINHLTITEDLFPPSTPNITTLLTIHIHGPLWPTRTETMISHCPNLQHVLCTIPYSFQTSYVTPAAQCTQALRSRLQSLISVEFTSSKRVAISLKRALADYIEHEDKLAKILISTITFDQELPCEIWFQECKTAEAQTI